MRAFIVVTAFWVAGWIATTFIHADHPLLAVFVVWILLSSISESVRLADKPRT